MRTNTFDPTKPVQTRSGRPARIICADRQLGVTNTPIISLVTSDGGGEYLNCVGSDGRVNSRGEMTDDLVNIPAIRYEYQAVYVSPTNPASRHSCLPAPGRAPRFGINKYTFNDDVLTSVEFIPDPPKD